MKTTTTTEKPIAEHTPRSKPKSCPFCGDTPSLFPVDPTTEGNAWGEVACVNGDCPARPRVRDGEDVADNRGSDAYKNIAIRRWNARHP